MTREFTDADNCICGKGRFENELPFMSGIDGVYRCVACQETRMAQRAMTEILHGSAQFEDAGENMKPASLNMEQPKEILVGVCREDNPADVDEAYGKGTYARLFPAEKDPTRHCFRENGCEIHSIPLENICCCCWQPPEAHTGCDCEGHVGILQCGCKVGNCIHVEDDD